MALQASVNALLASLITSATGVTEKNKPREFSTLRDHTLGIIRAHHNVRTNQFEVEARLDGLVEKFEILNRADLAAALVQRRHDLEKHRTKWLPEVLFLLLELSNRPVENVDLDLLVAQRPSSPLVPQLTWKDVLEDDPLTDEDLWAAETFSEDSSEDDVVVTRRPRVQLSERVMVHDEHIHAVQKSVVPTQLKLLSAIENAQFWASKSPSLQSLHDNASTLSRQQLPELAVLREIILMLHGLPTTIFSSFGAAVTYEKTITVAEVHAPALTDALENFADIGSRLNRLRLWLKRKQTIPLLQSFQDAVSACMVTFEMRLSETERQYVEPRASTTVSILQLEKGIRSSSAVVLQLADLVTRMSTESRPFACIELLYNDVCVAQAEGAQSVYESLASIFFRCFQVYLRPIRLWMQEGEVDTTDSDFFIFCEGNSNDLPSLWREQYQLRRDHDGGLLAPGFLRRSSKNIFIAGKSMVFLKKLGFDPNVEHQRSEPQLTYDAVCCPGSNFTLLPFPELVADAFDEWVRSKYSRTSSNLLRQLFEACNLSRDLDALEYVFLSRDGSLFQEFADQVFQRLDERQRTWNDRYLLSELAQRVFSASSCVDARKVSVRSFGGNRRVPQHGLKTLAWLDIDYRLSWPVLNVITRESLKTYQSVFSLLLQVYRTKYLLRQENASLRLWALDSMTLVVRQRLVWFTDVFYSYIVDVVLLPEIRNMRQKLSQADDVDALIEIHGAFVSRIGSKCLLNRNVAPVRDAITSLLDLAVLYADARAEKLGLHHASASSGKTTVVTRRRHRNAQQRPQEDSSDDNDDVDDYYDADTETLPDRERPGIERVSESPEPYKDPTFARAPYDQKMKMIRSQFGQLCNFATAGLRSVGRASGELCLEGLAERLEWGMLGRS